MKSIAEAILPENPIPTPANAASLHQNQADALHQENSLWFASHLPLAVYSFGSHGRSQLMRILDRPLQIELEKF